MLEIEIVDSNIIEGGVEVFARAWNENGQIGFGKDGTVDIERFRMFNPPILVPDENGDIVRESSIEDGFDVRVFREDPEEAILQSLTNTIEVKKEKFDSNNIIAGKIGHTTLTVYPLAGNGTAPIDGDATRQSVDETFAAIRAGAGNANTDSSATRGVPSLQGSATSNQYKLLQRAGFGFDTSVIGASTISSAIFSIYATQAPNTVLGDTDIDLVSFSIGSETIFANSDYGNFGTTRFATGKAVSAHTAGSYHDYTLNSTGKADINTSGNSWFGLRTKWDVDNSFTGSWVSSGRTRLIIAMSDTTGTAQDPKLVVEYSAGATSSIKSINTLAQANSKSWNGIAVADWDSINGISNVS